MQTRSRSVAVLLFDEVELLDVAGPLEVLSVAGRVWNWRPFKVWTLATRAGNIETRSQLCIQAAHALDELPAPELVVVPGGYGARRALDDALVVDWLRGAGQSAELVVGVGSGVLLLAKAGLVDGADVALPRDAIPLLGELAPTARALPDARTASSGRVLTAAGSAAGIDVALAAVARLLGAKLALGVATQLGHAWHPDAGAPEPLRVEIVTKKD